MITMDSLPAPSPSRLIWRVVFILFALLLGITGWVLVFHDSPPPRDADMIPQWSNRGGDGNPLALFCSEIKKTPVLQIDNLPKAERYVLKGSEPRVRDFLSRQAESFALLDKLLATDPGTWQWPGQDHVANLNHYSSNDLTSVTATTNIARIKVKLLCREGKHEEAARLSVSITQFGQGLYASEGVLIHQLVSNNTFVAGLALLEETQANASASKETLQQIQQWLQPLRGSTPASYGFALRAEYLSLKRLLPQARRQGWGIMLDGSTPAPGILGRMIKPHRTLDLDLSLTRPVVSALDQSWRDAFQANEKLNRDLDHLRRQMKKPRFYLDGNYGGKAIVSEMKSGTTTILDRTIHAIAHHQEVLTMLALRRFELQQGRLPATLDELVPAYLAALPIDPFAIEPLRWNPTSKTLYSVGPNLRDDGGAVWPGKRTRGDDTGSLYWWSPEAQTGRAEREKAFEKENTPSASRNKNAP